MNNTRKLAIIAIAMVFAFTSCASSKKNLSTIPAAPSATTAPVAEKTPETKTVTTAPAATSTSTSTSTTKKVVAISTTPAIAPPAKEKSLEERIDDASETITLAQAQEILTALGDPANDPDGKLTQKAIAKTQAIAKNLIDTAMTEEQIGYYLNLLNQAKDAYAPLLEQAKVSVQSYIDLADERLCCIQAYAKNSIYSYLKKYPKGHYTKELARMLSQKAGK